MTASSRTSGLPPIKGEGPSLRFPPMGRSTSSSRFMERVDHAQQQRAWSVFPVAVGHRYALQRCATFAAMVAYYGFVSILPLFLVATSLIRVFLAGYPKLQASVSDALVERFGTLGSELEKTIQPTTGDAVTIVVGLVVALWAGLGVMQSLQVAFNTIWGIPREEQPTFARARLRSLVIIAAFGVVLFDLRGASRRRDAAGALGRRQRARVPRLVRRRPRHVHPRVPRAHERPPAMGRRSPRRGPGGGRPRGTPGARRRDHRSVESAKRPPSTATSG